MNTQLKSLFSQLALTLDIPTSSEFDKVKHEYKNSYLKLDFNTVYGGYRIDIVRKNTGEDFFYFANRLNLREMTAFIQGLLIALDKDSMRIIKEKLLK